MDGGRPEESGYRTDHGGPTTGPSGEGAADPPGGTESHPGTGPGTFDRWSDEALAPELVGRSYAPVAGGPVLYVPVQRDGGLIGYLWASETEEAGDFQPLLPPDVAGNIARGWWTMEHVRLRGEGLTALEALRSCAGRVDDPRGGRVDADTPESRAASLEELRALARR
ncbi:hypothetical protein [Nocardiopsis lambiniae]|uniref:Uncharacterized protein n=1 Tax=Nocardiopsis lambiniae TaxID=3075539 RepID=A0ABU2M786_9ACTN|nr:hypothetical protein [Nocardiopsis sp. DSM 44743]MDT0328538.1 hypothetical protein [Nocardiopsis sp. DSM 44743]